MTALHDQKLPAGYTLFARYAFPPNELGYCGPADSDVLLRGDNPADVAAHAREFDGAWPYLRAIADAADTPDALGADIVRSYWVGGPLLDHVDPAALLDRLRGAFKGQVTGLLFDLAEPHGSLAHHSFHVLVVYPWVRFLDRDAATALKVLQDCRIRWGTVESVDDEHAQIMTNPLTFTDGALKRIAAHPFVREIVTTNTLPTADMGSDLQVISIAPALAEAIRRIHEGESVSALFGAN